MPQRVRGLEEDHLRAIASLERRCLDVDGGRLKLEWGALRSRPTAEVNDLLTWDHDELVGFCGRYQFGAVTPEVAGMVDPAHRGRGLGGELLDAMVQLCAERGDKRLLLVAPRSSEGARRLAARHDAVFDHAEHALVLTGLRDAPAGLPVVLRDAATKEDFDAAHRLRAAGFGRDLGSADEPTVVAELDGRIVGTLRVSADADGGRGIYGFVVDPALQGRGIGKSILRRICAGALAQGAPRVHLEVEVDNDHALGLYTATGFELDTTEDYYAIDVPGVA